MGRSWRIGTACGIGLYVHWSFLIVPIWAAWSELQSGGGMSSMLFGVAVVLALFGCVLLHELGHALMARKFGIGTRDITLLPIGGVARLEKMSEHPGEEIAIAIAGPLVNVVIAAGIWVGLLLSGQSMWGWLEVLVLGGAAAERFLAMLLFSNIMLVVFNLVPAFPMDGGRVFRALMSIGFGRLQGTEIAVGVAKVMAALFIIAGLAGVLNLAPTSPFLAIIGLFLIAAGNQELSMVRYQAYQQRQNLVYEQAPFVRPVDPSAQPPFAAQPEFSGFTWDPQAGAWIEWRNGRVVNTTYVNPAGR